MHGNSDDFADKPPDSQCQILRQLALHEIVVDQRLG